MYEMRSTCLRSAVAGGAAGLVNGFFGGGGGMVLIPLMMCCCKLDRRRAFASSVAVILPLCIASSGVYLIRGQLHFSAALPYLIGGLAGGLMGGRLFRRVSMDALRRIFALFLLYGGLKALL